MVVLLLSLAFVTTSVRSDDTEIGEFGALRSSISPVVLDVADDGEDLNFFSCCEELDRHSGDTLLLPPLALGIRSFSLSFQRRLVEERVDEPLP